MQFGAHTDGQSDSTSQIQACIDAAAEHGGGTVLFPAGTFVSGTLWLRDNITLHLDAGATLLGSEDFDAFPSHSYRWEGPRVVTRAALISGEGLRNIAIVGRGTIDGRGTVWWRRQKELDDGLQLMRPRLIRLVDCKNVLVDGVMLANAAAWTLNPVACDNVTITRLTVVNPPNSPNTDGINPDSCSNVRISDCHIDVGDDCITIKSGSEEDGRKQFRPCENITITNCTMMHGHGGVVIGSEMSGGVRNVAISNCTFIGTDRGIRIKSRRGRGAAVEDVRAGNLVMDGVLCPIAINLFYGCGAWEDPKVTDRSAQPVDAGTPRFRRLRFSNISARNVKYSAAFVLGLPEMWVEDLIIENFSVWLDPTNTKAGDSDMAPDIEQLCRAGLIFRHVRGLKLRNIDVHDQIGPAVRVEQGAELSLSAISTSTVQKDAALLTLTDVQHASIRACEAPLASFALVQLQGASTQGIWLGENRVARPLQAVATGDGVPPDALTGTPVRVD